MKLPECLGYKIWTDYGYEYDCEYNIQHPCEYCLCNYYKTKGIINPETGKSVNKIIAFLLYGKSKYE